MHLPQRGPWSWLSRLFANWRRPTASVDSKSAETTSQDLEAFAAIVERFADAMHAGRFDQSKSAIEGVFQWLDEHSAELPPSDRLELAAIVAERHGDWSAAEQLYSEQIKLETTETRARPHARLGKLYRFLGRQQEAFEHGRKAYEVSASHELAMSRAMGALAFASLSSIGTYSAEVESALRTTLQALSVDPLYDLARAMALVEIAAQRRLAGNAQETLQLVDEAFATIEPQSVLHDLPGYQHMISRALQVRAMAQGARGDSNAAVASWQNAVDWQARARESFPDETPIDADEHARFLASAAAGLAAAGAINLAREVRARCNAIRTQWGLTQLDAGDPSDPGAPSDR